MSRVRQAYAASCRLVRKLNRGRRFNRAKWMKALRQQTVAYWSEGIDELFAYLALHDGWEKLQRHVQLGLASQTFAKAAMTDADRKFLADLLANFGYFGDAAVAGQAAAIIEACSIPTFEAAATFALKQLGVISDQFQLRNEAVRTALLARSEAAVFSTKTAAEEALQTITQHFVELGQHPYNADAIAELRGILGGQTEWQAKRFALTETGIAAELAQVETYRRNGVGAKQWNALDDNTRESHMALNGAVVGIAQKFDVGGYPGDHPLDPKLPASEICNCHCWLSPVLEDDFDVDPARVWEGE